MANKVSNCSIFKDTNRKVWRASFKWYDKEEKRHTKSTVLSNESGEPIPCIQSTNKNKSAAERAALKWYTEATESLRVESELEELTNLTVSEYAQKYLKGAELGNEVEPSTLRGYYSSSKYLDYPFNNINLSTIKMKELTPAQVEEWKQALMQERGLSSTTASKHFRFLRMLCIEATTLGHISRNPTDRVKAPKKVLRKHHGADTETTRAILSTLNEMNPTPIQTAACIAIYTGMRRGEITSLQWCDVDLKAKTIHVREATGSGIGGTYQKQPKNNSSIRTISFTDTLKGILQERKNKMLEDCISVGITDLERFNQMYVIGKTDGTITTPHTITHQWRALADLQGWKGITGQPLTFHDLRHTNATQAIKAGADIVNVSKNLGHASVKMTLDVYASADPEGNRIAAQKLDELITPVEKEEAEVITLKTGTDQE